MSSASLVAANLVVYAKDIDKVARFYRQTLSLAVIEAERDFVLVGNGRLEIAVVRMPDAIAREIEISEPPRIRETTPLKFSFLVDDLDRVHADAATAGGATKPLASAWRWRGQWHLDGHDPEGNVVQFRMADAG